jgi:hypothetical protein
VNHKSSLQGIPFQRPACRQIQLRQNAASGFQINGLGILHGRPIKLDLWTPAATASAVIESRRS